ncbi:MAG: LytR/AlgR family response regulator transcription factor [Aquaticitalea sp.]
MTNQQNIKILIVEDDIIIADFIEELLKESNFKKIRIANDKESAISEISEFLPDIILMDINLSGVNSGIELSKLKNKNANVIFVTGQYDFALMNEALKTNPDAYLTKPIKKVDLLASINLALHKKENNIFQFKDGYDEVNLNYSDILYFNADGNYSNIHTASKKYTIRQSLNTILDALTPDNFIQTHRSFIVNKQKVQRAATSYVIVNGVEIPLSRSYAKLFKSLWV